MSTSDDDSVEYSRTGSPSHHRRKHSMESSKSPRSSKHHHSRSRSRSRSRDRKRDRKHRRSRSRSKEARKRDSEKLLKSHKKTDEQHEQTERGKERLSAENGDERSRRKEKKPSRGRSHSRSHSRERHHHSRSRDRRRSQSRSRDRKKKARSRSGSRAKHRHRSRSHSKSRERKKRSEKVRRKSRSRTVSPPTFRGRNTAMDAQEALARRLERAKKLQEQKEKEMLEKQQQQHQEIAAVATPLLCDTVAAAAAAAATNPVLNVAALLASGTQVTPQIAMAAQMAALQAKTLAETGIAVPSYYNPSAVNPMKFAEQEKKRKKLWQGKKEGDKSQTAELWEKLNFGNKDQNVKFRKLMGIKADEDGEASKPLNDEGLKTLQQQEEMFRNLDVQYEMARSQTHTQRGMGLGFSSSFSRGMDTM
ncbi:arginine/serine-rich coiled-coil protein 2 isoform X2 [Lampris incognitus]|uniref:arginine/serine-rich coiled-coil protein 2 isoform X2 n=1 Tax=Lampris incognitus TaxID=2546036 RepID=UPI0024B4E4AB|nr:arginine/serine-rich coiled-coil protein 2 isoform X2 [Lampris incognitus]